jgi:uncharacterized membrane protein YqjE
VRTAPSGNLFGSLHRLFATTLELLGVRLELLGTELEWAKRRGLASLFWGGLGLILTGVGVLLACTFVMILFWEQYRLVTAGAMALFFLAIGAGCLRHSWKRLDSPGGIFALSLKELARDGAMLNKERLHEPP